MDLITFIKSLKCANSLCVWEYSLWPCLLNTCVFWERPCVWECPLWPCVLNTCVLRMPVCLRTCTMSLCVEHVCSENACVSENATYDPACWTHACSETTWVWPSSTISSSICDAETSMPASLHSPSGPMDGVFKTSPALTNAGTIWKA